MTITRTKPTDDDIVSSITEYLHHECGARLCDNLLFPKIVQPLVEAYGQAAVDAALRQHHLGMRREVARQIRLQRNYAAWIKRESSKRRRRCEECQKHWADPPSRLCPGCEAYAEHQR